MFNITDYLKRATGFIKKNGVDKEYIIQVIQKHTTIELKPEDIEIKNGVLITKLTPLQKNILVIKKSLVLEELREFNISDIR